jgi:hypothetical protein
MRPRHVCGYLVHYWLEIKRMKSNLDESVTKVILPSLIVDDFYFILVLISLTSIQTSIKS